MQDGMRQYEFDNIQVHHIEPLAEAYHRRLDNYNLFSLCSMHHDMAEKGKINREEQLAIAREQELKADES
jgi:predicted restriction endonuclease